MSLQQTKGYQVILAWLESKGIEPFAFQEETWQHIIDGHSGLVNAPTGCGKTFAVFLGAVIDFINEYPEDYRTRSGNRLRLLWITPLRALAKDIGRAMTEVVEELGMKWKVGIRNGDTEISEREKQKRQMPEVLTISPSRTAATNYMKTCLKGKAAKSTVIKIRQQKFFLFPFGAFLQPSAIWSRRRTCCCLPCFPKSIIRR